MGVSSRGGLFGFVARLGPPPAADSDADLLDRFVRTADEHAFAGIVRRHGPMVLATCRRRLGRDADAEDAFQATFLALARAAATIGRRESLPGWLYRVAYLVSLKAAGRRARRPLAALPAAEVPMPDPPMSPCEAADLKAVIDAELAGLPDKFRAVVVLCLIEGRTNAEAAAVLGVPVGTVDSRLSTARKRLQVGLTRRGVAVGTGLTLGQMLGGPVAASGPGFTELVSHTVRAVLAEAAGPGAGAITPAVAELARGACTMTTNLRLLAVLGVALGLLGGAGAGVYFATAADPAAPDQPLAKPIDPADPKANSPAGLPEGPPAPDPSQPEKNGEKSKADDAGAAAAALDKPFGVKIGGASVPLKDLLEQVEELTDLVVRVDVAAFRRIGTFGDDANGLDTTEFLKGLYETQAVLPRKVDRMPIRDVLADALAQVRFSHPATYQIRGSQLVIVPAFVPPYRPGVNPLALNDQEYLDGPVIAPRTLQEQIYGGVVGVAADRKPLPDILADLRKQTGANIVLDPRVEEQGKLPPLTLTLSDARLYDALRVIADMAGLKMVYAGNIYYVTTPANAKTFQPAPQPPASQGPVSPFGGPPPGPNPGK